MCNSGDFGADVLGVTKGSRVERAARIAAEKKHLNDVLRTKRCEVHKDKRSSDKYKTDYTNMDNWED